MAELEEKLNAILNDPQAMGQIPAAARAPSGQDEGEKTADQAPGEGPSAAAENGPAAGDAGQLFSALGDLDPRWVKLGVRLMGEYSRQDDKKAALLEALKPFLKPERRAKVDQAARLARLSRVARAALRFYQEGREEEKGDV